MRFDGDTSWETDNFMSYNQVGSYCFASAGFQTLSLSPGGTLAGSSLRPAAWTNTNITTANTSGQTDVYQENASQSGLSQWNAATLSGTWMCMGLGTTYDTNRLLITLWLRIS